MGYCCRQPALENAVRSVSAAGGEAREFHASSPAHPTALTRPPAAKRAQVRAVLKPGCSQLKVHERPSAPSSTNSSPLAEPRRKGLLQGCRSSETLPPPVTQLLFGEGRLQVEFLLCLSTQGCGKSRHAPDRSLLKHLLDN